MQAAADALIAELSSLGGKGGVITAPVHGEAGWAFNTPGMYRGLEDASGARRVAIYGDE